ncbi:hypothetical protein F4553_003051 [Allocatelliglobosispora scoriae]|uniref:Uncharacterized protein n=1 Tax=Allocatelliglobosispora scoriae TaxID=643052 RepID=A0A841BSG4_9ACTN|nr:hypothetical protein [Allocatelliglobosispora scoriae]
MTRLATLAMPLLILAVIVTLGYAALCSVAPYRRCRRCHGAGHTRAMLGRSRPCHRCRTTGLRLRLGWRLANHARRLRRDSTRGGTR